MIPKIIHYCWMSGDAYPEKIRRCMASWRKMLPDYEIWLWDARRFDIHQSAWVREAFEAKKYAFCADYIRLYALYNYGGIYLDSDVEVVKPYDDLLHLPYFIGDESKEYFEAATIGSEPHHPFIGHLLAYYKDRHFIGENGQMDITVMPWVMMMATKGTFRRNVIHRIEDFDYSPDVVNVFPYDWFSPIDTTGERFVLRQTEHTYSIHHFANSWVDWKKRLVVRLFGANSPTVWKLQRLVHRIKKWRG